MGMSGRKESIKRERDFKLVKAYLRFFFFLIFILKKAQNFQ